MRFDDMLATVLAQPLGNAAARTAIWHQLADVLAQRPAESTRDENIEWAYALLTDLRGKIPAREQAATARSLAGRAVSPDLLAFFAAGGHVIDHAKSPIATALPIAADVELETDSETQESQMVWPFRRSSAANEVPAAPSEAQFLWPLRRAASAAQPDSEPHDGGPLESFRFEADAVGVVIWTDAKPRGCLIGYSLAAAAVADGEGVDGQVAGAFRHRAPFRDARLTLAGDSPAAGEWRLSGVPFFDHADGRFLGYRGTGRRPRLDETASPRGGGAFGSAIPADALRQLVHELRTPLNAVAGFAEMIDGQFLGPAAAPYRVRASQIVGEAKRLLRAVDDLDVAARIETQRIGLEPTTVDAVALIEGLGREYGALAHTRGATLKLDVADTPPIDGDMMAVDRMFSRLLGASAGLAEDGEQLRVVLASDGNVVSLRVAKPALVAGRDERQLLDPGYTPDGEWPDAPLLGLGFTLRLVGNLALAARGRLEIDRDAFVLTLPAIVAGAIQGEGQA